MSVLIRMTDMGLFILCRYNPSFDVGRIRYWRFIFVKACSLRPRQTVMGTGLRLATPGGL
jgi:hypothetical protein